MKLEDIIIEKLFHQVLAMFCKS